MDLQPHPLLQFLVRMKPTSTDVFLQVTKNVEVTRGTIWTVRRMFKCFPTKLLKLIPHQIGSMGTDVIIQKDASVRQHSMAFWLYGAFHHPQPPRNEPHLSALLCLPRFPMLVTSRAMKKQLRGYVRFHSAYLLPYIWLYPYVTTVLPAFAMNVLWRVFGFHLTAHHISYCLWFSSPGSEITQLLENVSLMSEN